MLANSVVIEKFLNEYESKSTQRAYSSALEWFFESINVEPDKYFGNERDYGADIKKFRMVISQPFIDKRGIQKVRPPKTTLLYTMAVKQFLLQNGVELKTLFWKNLFGRSKSKKARPLTQDRAPTKEEIMKILSHATIRDRVVTLCLISSGCRVGELLQVKMKDLHLDRNPAEIDIQAQYTKTGVRRTVFISNEAKAAILEWNKVRSQKLQSSINKLDGINVYRKKNNLTCKQKTTEDDRLIPFSYLVIVQSWERTLKAAGLNQHDDTTDRCVLHLHTLRKYFRTFMGGDGGMGVDITEKLMGHEAKYGGAYDRLTTEVMGKAYLREMSIVSMYETQDSTDVLQQRDREISKLTQELQKSQEQFEQRLKQMELGMVERVLSTLKSGNPKVLEQLLKGQPNVEIGPDGETTW